MNTEQDESSFNQQYQKQFFGFTTLQMITGVSNAGKFYAEEMRKKMKDELMDKGMSADDAQNFCQDISQEWISNFSRNATALMEYLPTNVFHIPNDILLPEDEVQIDQYSEEDEKQLDQEIQSACQEMKMLQNVKAMILKESQSISQLPLAAMEKSTSYIKEFEELRKQINNGANEVASLQQELDRQ